MSGRHAGLALLVVALSSVCPSVSQAQSPPLDELLARTATHILRYVPRLANVVCEEEYVQRRRDPDVERRLRSDFLLVHYPPAGLDQWMVFRDVLEVDGKSLADQQQQRVMDLFIKPTGNVVTRARRIAAEGLRYHLRGFSPVVVNPLAAIIYLQGPNQRSLRFHRGDEDRSMGPGVRIVRFEEPEAAAYRNVDPADRPPRVFGPLGGRGRAWIEEATGRVLKAELRLPGLGSPMSTTTFRLDDRLGIDVPAEMQTSWPDGGMARNQVAGVATYSRCRRFQVEAETTIDVSPR